MYISDNLSGFCIWDSCTRFSSTQPQCCLTFSWTGPQMLLRCCLKSIIILWHFWYLRYLCPYLDLGLFMLYLCNLFFIFIFSMVNCMIQWMQTHICSSTYFLEYFLFLWMITWIKNVNNFQIAKVQYQGVA